MVRGYFRSSIGAVVMVCVGVALVPMASANASQVYWRSIRNKTLHDRSMDVLRPRVHVLLADRALRTMRWSRWGPATATGSGKYVATCYFPRPNNRCANWLVPVKLMLSRVRACPDGTRIFTRLVIRNPLPEPSVSGRRRRPYRPLVLTYDCRGRSTAEGTG